MRINGHGHLLPYPEDIPAFMREKEIFWIDKDRSYMRQKDWNRPVTSPSFFLKEKLEWMEENDIDHEIILNLSQLYCNGKDRETTYDVIRFQNDFNARMQKENPKKITSGFVVQPAYIDDALDEIERCVNLYDLPLLCLPSHFLSTDGEWTSVGDESVYPIYDLADAYELAVEIHPYDGPKMINIKDRFWRFHLVWMCAQTADTYHLFTLLDIPAKYPKMRTCFAHGNQFGQINLGRRIKGYEGRPDLFEGAVDPRKSLGAKNVFFDTLVHDIDSFELLIKRQGISQVIAGLDTPYPLGDIDDLPHNYVGKVIQEAVDHKVISQDEKNRIWYDNVINWIAGEKKSSFLERINQ